MSDKVNFGPANTSAITSVSVTTASTSLLVANPARLGTTVYNNSGATLFVKLGATASTTSFSYKLEPFSTLELPVPIYVNQVNAVTSTGTATVLVTELTA